MWQLPEFLPDDASPNTRGCFMLVCLIIIAACFYLAASGGN